MAPYGCFYATTEVEFAFIEGDADIINKPTVVVTSTSEHPELLALFGKDYSKIEAGDELLAINGLSFIDWFQQNKFKYGFGANEFGGQRSALDYLTAISGEINRLPSEDFITFQFKSHDNPQNSYTVTVPYVSIHDDECWNIGSNLYKSITSITLPGTPETCLPVSTEQPGHNHKSDTPHLPSKGYKMDSPENPKRGVAMGKMSSPEQKSTVSMNPIGVTKITWDIYKPESTNMGIIKLDGFSPEDVGTTNLAVLKAVMIVRSLLANELKDTNSVMYDLRGNSGGNIRFANSMVQLFKPDFKPFGDRYLMNPITYKLFVYGKDPDVNPYAKAWQETKEGSRFTNVFFINPMKSVNTLGQAYLRPMGVLNDGRCYSSCEVFAGSIQGHGAGIIFGEDGQTGGGGAIVMKLDPALIRASRKDFKKFPFSQGLTSGSITYANTLTVGITQTIRTGRYNGQTIEDVGIKTDTVVRPQWSDLQPYPTTNTQYDRIAASLARTGRKNGQSKLHFVCEPFEIENSIGGFLLKVEAAGIYEFIVLQADGKTVAAKQRRSRATTKQKFAIPVSTVGSALGNSHITIVGKTAGKQVLKTHRNVRTIPTNDNYMKISTSGFIFEGISDSVGLYQSPATAPGNGWNNLNGPWMIGKGFRYASNVDSSLDAFFTAPVGTEINIGLNVDLDTELGCDFLYLSVKSSGGIEDFLIRSKRPLIDTPVPVQHRRLYRATTKKAICRAKNAYRAWLASRDSILSPQETIQGKYNQYTLAEATASRLTKQDDRLRWRSHCTRIDNLLAGGCAKQAWNAAKRMACASGHSCRSSNPIRNEEGVLQFQPISICNTLRSHYMRLAEAGEGHSLDPTHWETMPQPPQHIPPSSTLSMDLPFSLRELDHALGSMHPRKAPGDDGITTALMQAIAHDPKDHGTGDVNLDRPGALALLRVANTIFLSGVIPKVWRCATIISIPKKGDATLASNLRGISLINVGLKILCKMVQARLSSLLESNNVLVPEQGGFRTREESTAQVCALMDILRRRQIADLNSHIAFIDISKAFDTVPIHALLFKLRCIGIPTITMNFLSALYSTSNARIRSGSLLSDPFPVQRGVRQGCPLSGLLFNVFINDVLDGVAPISVPGLSQEHHPRGLMFADDIAIIAPSHESLCTSMGTIADWATRWEMSFGVAKCGIMHVAPIPTPLSRLRFCQLNSQSESAAAETADQTPTTPSSHQSSPIFPSIPLSIYSDISSTSSYHPSSPLSTSSSIYIPASPLPQPALFSTPATPTQTQITHPIQLHGIDLPSVSQYEYLGVIIDDLLNLSPWLAKKKRAITAATHSISPLLRNNALSTRYRLTIFNGLVLGVAYYGLELIGGNSTLARRLQAPVNTGIRMILKAPLFTPITPMLTDCGIISLDAHAILARVRLTVKATTLKTPLRTLLLPSTIPSHSNSWFWTRRSRSLIRFVHPNMSLFHFNIPISTNGLFHNPISTNSSITSSNISRSIPNTQSLHTRITTTSTTIPSTPTIAEIRHQRSKYALERTFQVWGKSKLACSYVQANHASSAKFLRSPALSTGQAIGASLLSLARCGGLWDYPRALKAGLLHPTATNPDQLGSPSLCILCHAHLDCKPMAHLVVDCTHPTVFFARVDTQLLQAINDTRVQIFDCTLHTTTTTTTTTTTPASPSFSTTSSNSNPDSTGTSAIWDSMDIHTPIDNYQHSPRTTSQSSPSSPSSPSDFSIFSFSHFSPDTRFEPPISVAHQEIPRQAQDTVEENPTASRTTTTDTHTAAISSTPTPTQISYIGSDDILTVLLGGSLPGTNTAGNTEACPGQQWLTGTVEEGNLLSSNQPVAHRMCDFLQISVRVYRAMLWKHHKSNLSHIPDI
ncbi:hypothetical protein BASA83_013343 [Batrachochytrium salamandrivorans]|nr:hypothetical protein BASA83_013343 [Batrachochytrium salamandrivorans]